MEGDRRPVQPDADDDGDAAAPHHRSAQDDAGDTLDDHHLHPLHPPLPFTLPKDPDTKKEMEEMQAKMSVNNVPEMSEMITNLFGGAPAPKKKPAGGGGAAVRSRR